MQKNSELCPLKILATEDGRWRVKSECGQEAEFDAVIVATTFFWVSFGTTACLKVVVTAPVPQILQLGGTVHERLQDQPQLLQKLEKVSFLRLSFSRYKSIHSVLYMPVEKRWNTQPVLFSGCSSTSQLTSVWTGPPATSGITPSSDLSPLTT